MALATCADNKPWVCQVHFAHDDELNLYFSSNVHSRHCQEIAANPHVSGSITLHFGPTDKPQCIDFEGTAEIVADISEEDFGYKAYDGKFPGRINVVEFLKPENGGKLYKITVSDYYMIDATGTLNPPGKHHLPLHK